MASGRAGVIDLREVKSRGARELLGTSSGVQKDPFAVVLLVELRPWQVKVGTWGVCQDSVPLC